MDTFSERKIQAIKLRKGGLSIGKIEKQLKIPRSTLSGWFKNIALSQEQKDKLLRDWKDGLVHARRKAVLWHNAQKQNRMEEAYNTAQGVLKRLNLRDINILELAFAFLYLGEGAKKNVETAIGNSDPSILKFSLAILKRVYNMDVSKIRCELYLRADQNPEEIKKFWARELGLPLQNFKQINIDKRTQGSPTYPDYKGVCNLRCGSVAIQRRLVYLSKLFSDQVIDKYLGL